MMASPLLAPAASFARVRTPARAGSKPLPACRAQAQSQPHAAPEAQLAKPCRRQALAGLALSMAAMALPAAPAVAEGEAKMLCDAACVASLEKIEMVTLPSGLRYRDIVVGSGPNPQPGYQAVVDYVAMTDQGRVFENSLEKGKPFDIRVVTGDTDNPANTIAGLNEGLKTMQPGGLRRLYIPGPLGFPNGLPSGPGRPRLPPGSDVVFDVKLLYIPGLQDFDL